METASVLFFEIWVAILRYMYDHPEKEGQSTVMRSGMAIFLVSSLVYVFLAVVISVFFEFQGELEFVAVAAFELSPIAPIP